MWLAHCYALLTQLWRILPCLEELQYRTLGVAGLVIHVEAEWQTQWPLGIGFHLVLWVSYM